MRRQIVCTVVIVWLTLVRPSEATAAGQRTAPPSPRARQAVIVRADQAWTQTAIDVAHGERLRIEAQGIAHVVRPSLRDRLLGEELQRRVGPQGTYLWPKRYEQHVLPLPALANGPFPAFCLIGKIDQTGPPFYVGAHFDGPMPASGRLWLGINDDDLTDNRGQFVATIEPSAATPPPAAARPVVEPTSSGTPIAGARVLVMYVDGLRLDVLEEMAAGGFLPNITRIFLDDGLVIPNAVTVFPSSTLIANGSLFTGLFSDRTGIKSQNQFERSTLKPKGQLSAWLPDGFIPHPPTRVLNLLDKYAPEDTQLFLDKRRIPTLASRLGKRYKWTTLPIAPLNPPPQWLHRAINTLGPFNLSGRLPEHLDAVNARYAIEELIGDPEADVITVWLPMVDKTCHHSRRGQFGSARRDLALVDRSVGEMLQRLREVRWDRSTYLILLSDHGHLGGESAATRRCNLPRDWAHRQLGVNAKVVGQEWLHPGIEPSRFLFFDNQGAGQATVFLPYGSYQRGPWQRNRLYELTHYEVRPGQSVNLLDSLRGFRPPEWDAAQAAPVDLILVKLDAHRVFVERDADHQAIIHREADEAGREVYRYEPVRHLAQSADSELHYGPPLPGLDPLGYLQDPHFLASARDASWLATPHTADEWLAATSQTRYPDAVVAMAKFFAWQSPVDDLADVRDPDLMVTAAAGWSFRSDDEEGTDHGYPLAESMRMTLLLAGPNIRRGTLPTPQRIVDVLPTILEMLRQPYGSTALDGRAISGIYE